MEVVPLSPVHVASLRWRRDARTWVLTLVAKMTFALQPGEMRPSPQQERLHDRDVYWEDDPARSLVSASDMAPFKPLADVLLVGHAFAPQGGRVRSLVARIVCGSVDKAIAVYGDRAGARGEPAAFSRMALTYERAPGGPGTANPVGVPEGRLPNLEAMSPPVPAEEGGAPVGFGPVAPGWPLRQARLRQHATFSPDEPLDDGIDPEFFNVAPPDQRLAALRTDEILALDNLHAEHARLVTRLPGLMPIAYAERGHGAQEIDLRIDTLLVDTTRARVAVTWRGQLALAHRDEQGRVLVAVVDGRKKLAYEDVKRLDHALTGDRASAPAPQPQPRRPAPAPLPRIGDDDDDEPNRSTVAMHVPPEIEAMRAARVSVQSAPAPEAVRRPASIPPPPPVPQRSTTGAPAQPSRPPARRSSVVEAPRSSFAADKEKTSTELFITADSGPAADAMPAWLAPSGTPSARAPAPAAPAAPIAPPPALPEPPAPVVALSQPSPVEARSPWAAGAPVGGPAMIAPVPSPVSTTRAPEPEPSSPGQQARPRPQAVRAQPAEVLDLLWFDKPALPRIRSRFGAIVDELEFEPLDPRHDLPVDDTAASRDRHHAFGVLTRAEPTDARGVTRAMLEAVGDRGQFTPPLVVVGGNLRFLFDEVETLKVAAGAAKPLAKDDKKLTDLLESYAELLETPLLQGAPGVIDGLLKELQAAVQQAKRALPVKFLDAHVERVLLEQRRYQKRKIFGGTCIRALLTIGREGAAVPAYLPESAADKLPLATEVKVRLVAEANQSQDQYETHAHALRIVVLGRVLGVS